MQHEWQASARLTQSALLITSAKKLHFLRNIRMRAPLSGGQCKLTTARRTEMNKRLFATVAAAALIAGTSFVSAQSPGGAGGGSPGGASGASGGATMSREAPA